MTHLHSIDGSQVVEMISRELASSCSASCTREEKKELEVAGAIGFTSKVNVVERIYEVATKALFLKIVSHESLYECQQCKQWFLSLLQNSECKIALGIMQQFASSCECVRVINGGKTIEVILRKSASFYTQKVVPIPPIYFGPFERVCEVQQGQFAISSSNAPKNVLATWHLASCCAVVGFDKTTRVGFLFHFDETANPIQAVSDLKKMLKEPYNFECHTVGAKALAISIREAFLQSQGFSFSKESLSEDPFEFTRDSYWSRAVRLSRSVAIDLTLEEPLARLFGYEPEINPNSSLHMRAKTLEEADEFCLKRDSKMQCVYSSP